MRNRFADAADAADVHGDSAPAAIRFIRVIRESISFASRLSLSR